MTDQPNAGAPAPDPDVYAVPGEDSVIDTIRPDGLTSVLGESFEQVRARHPAAVRMTWATWRAAAIERQRAPIHWQPTTADKYMEMLEVLPPIEWRSGAFLVGEPIDHCHATGRPRFQAYRQIDDRFYASNRAITVLELRAELKLAPAIVID